MLDTLDILVYDIQDVGLRFHTFISPLRSLVEDCAAFARKKQTYLLYERM